MAKAIKHNVDELRKLLEESKFVRAVELVDESGLEIPDDIEFESIRERVASLQSLREVCNTDEEWRLQKDSQGVRTFYRNLDKSSHIHSIRLDGDVDAPVFTLLSLLHEVDLFTRWIPSYALLGLSFAKLVDHPSPTELVVHLNVNVPWPFSSRYTFFKCDGIDCMDDSVPQIGVMLNNLTSEKEYGVDDQGVKTTFHPPSGILLTPLGGGRTRVQIVVNVDPQIALVPDWLIDFAVRNLAFLIILQIRKAVDIVKGDPEYTKRMCDESSEFYNHIKRRITESLPDEVQYLPNKFTENEA